MWFSELRVHLNIESQWSMSQRNCWIRQTLWIISARINQSLLYCPCIESVYRLLSPHCVRFYTDFLSCSPLLHVIPNTDHNELASGIAETNKLYHTYGIVDISHSCPLSLEVHFGNSWNLYLHFICMNPVS